MVFEERKNYDISIHAAREGGDVSKIKNSGANIISIHAAREGGDGHILADVDKASHFNPRRP